MTPAEPDGAGPRLLAVSDLHVSFKANREIVAALRPDSPGDWLLVAGDVGEKAEDIEWVLRTLRGRFSTVVWVPGNHELWALSTDPVGLRGDARYRYLVSVCHRLGVLTPEDPYPLWPGEGPKTAIVPLLTLYDYSVRPPGVARADVIQWAAEAGIVATDERRLDPAPYADIVEWCQARIAVSERRLAEIPADTRTVLINHYPLRPQDVILPRKPRYAPWSGTRATADWHRRFRARAVVYGHLHVRTSRFADGVHFQEVSLGYPRHWDQTRGAESYLRRIL